MKIDYTPSGRRNLSIFFAVFGVVLLLAGLWSGGTAAYVGVAMALVSTWIVFTIYRLGRKIDRANLAKPS